MDKKTKWVIVYTLLYFVIMSIAFELIVKLHQTLRDYKVFLEFGHANLLLLELFFICYLTAIGFVISIFYKRKNNN